VRIGFVTIGQSPREDVLPEIAAHLPPGVEILEAGALDGLSQTEIERHKPRSPERTLVTRLTDGTEVHVDLEFIHDRLVGCVRSLEGRVDLIAFICSGSLPRIPARVPVLFPHELLKGFLSALSFPGPLGVLVPAREQVEPMLDELSSWEVNAVGAGVSPYTEREGIKEAVEGLLEQGAVAFLLNCFGYTERMKREVQAASGRPVIAVRSLLTRALAELA